MIREEGRGREEKRGKNSRYLFGKFCGGARQTGRREGERRGTEGRFEAETARCVQDVSLEK